MCGEHLPFACFYRADVGSSPRVWGTFPFYIFAAIRTRFIPTCVGNMEGGSNLDMRSSGSSPRVWGTFAARVVAFFQWRFIPTCVGNMYKLFPAVSWSTGSSPRVWGTYDAALFRSSTRRFIPTCVGNIPSTRQFSTPAPVHPHVCGEHVRQRKRVNNLRRFIPTCVGNMKVDKPIYDAGTVHPHVCGEHSLGNATTDAMDGSSPRVWGTCFTRPRLFLFARFIPTCVGNMLVRSSSRWSVTVHPHVCGEHHCHARPLFFARRFIPTCVGNITDFCNSFGNKAVHPHVCGEHAIQNPSRALACGSSPRVWGTYEAAG